MNAIIEFFNSHSGIIFILMIFVLLFISYQLWKINKRLNIQKKRYDMLLMGRGNLNLGDLVQAHSSDIFEINKKLKEFKSEIEMAKSKSFFSIQKIGFVKYDAFYDLKNKLSYSIAMLDSFNNGILFTTIYGRESCITYAKKVKSGSVSQELSKEEIEALRMAMEK